MITFSGLGYLELKALSLARHGILDNKQLKQ